MSKDRILVVGDVIVDRYNYGTAIGISAETPTIVAKLDSSKSFVGGAALVARHLLRLGSKVDLMTVIGFGEPFPEYLIEESSDPLLEKEKASFFDCAIQIQNWKTTTKIRSFVGDYKMLQYDIRNDRELDQDAVEHLCERFNLFAADAAKVVVCDNRHGTLHPSFIMHIVKTCKDAGIPLYVDVQCSQEISNHDLYTGADYFFMNEKEIQSFADSSWLMDEYENLTSYDQAIQAVHVLQAKAILVKQGKTGGMFIPPQGVMKRWGGVTTKVEAVDTCGAGDAFLAAFVATDSLDEAATWAARSTTYVGTIVPTLET